MKPTQPFITLSTGRPGFRRAIHPEVRIVDRAQGLVDYIASDESIDSYREVIRARGWRFTNFSKNAPFVDSHNYDSLEKQLGRVTEFRVEGSQLIERVQWAIDVPECKLASLGFRMTEGGYLKAVSVGFYPVRYVSKWDTSNPDMAALWAAQLKELGLDETAGLRSIYLEQEQIELSACIIGANPNALAKAYKADVIGEADLEFLAGEYAKRTPPAETSEEEPTRQPSPAAASPALAAWAIEQGRRAFLERIDRAIKTH